MRETLIVCDNAKYTLYSNGTLFSHQKNRFMALLDNGNGYKNIRLQFAHKTHAEYIHRLVAKYFIPNPLNLSEVNHKDGDKSNNNVENLEWCTHLENIRHAREAGFFAKEVAKMKKNQRTWIGRSNTTRTVTGLTGEKNKTGNYKVWVKCNCGNEFKMYFSDFKKDKQSYCRKCRPRDSYRS